MQTYRVLQFGLSALGLGVLIFCYFKSFAAFCRSKKGRMWDDGLAWMGWGMLISGVFAFALNFGSFQSMDNAYAVRVFIFLFLVT